jgi:hypothetical protein
VTTVRTTITGYQDGADTSVEDLPGQTAAGAIAEPFFGDAPGDAWKVVGRSGQRFRDLRQDDVIVRRSEQGWRCMLAEDVGRSELYQPGPYGLLRDDTVVLRRQPRRRWRALLGEADGANVGELIEVCGFFGPNNVRLTQQQVRDGVVARATAEWTAWHNAANAPRSEGDAAMFGRLVGYYLSAMAAILPDTLAAIQATALGAINYAPLLATGAAIDTEAARIARLLVAGAPGSTPGLQSRVEAGLKQAREAHTDTGDFSAWSAAFVTACVRGAAITLGLEAVIPPGRRHIGRDELLLASLGHAAYTAEARIRRAAFTPRRLGTYHAFLPGERAPQLGDIIVQDRRTGITAAQVRTLANVAQGHLTHGDIVVAVDPAFVVTVGGNVGDSSLKRRYPRDAAGLLVVNRQQLYTQETSTGVLPALPLQSAQPLHTSSTARIFALLSPVEQCAAVPGQPYGGGILT